MMDAHVLAGKDYLPGDPPPDGYLAWHEWAEIQNKAGLRQCQCVRCGKWKFPQELGERIDRATLQSRRGPVAMESRVCLSCEAVNHDQTNNGWGIA